jgi:protein SCO1/2
MIVERFGVQPRTSPEALPGKSAYFPNVLLETHRNRLVRFYDDLLKGKVVVISFMYTRCEGTCPPTILSLRRLQDALGVRARQDVFLYSITLDPEYDVAPVLRRYARTVGAGPGWSFLTGMPDDIELLRRRLGFVDPDPVIDADKSQHARILLCGSEPADRWVGCPAPFRTDRIIDLLARITGEPIFARAERRERAR